MRFGRREEVSVALQREAWSVSQSFRSIAELSGRRSVEVREDLLARNEALRERLAHGVLGEMVARAGELDPLVHGAWRATTVLNHPPFHAGGRVRQMAAMRRMHEEADSRPAQVVIVVPKGRWGSAPRLEGHLALVLAEVHGADEIVVVRTDHSEPGFAGRFPEGTRHVDLAEATRAFTPDERQRVLVELIRSFQPAVVFNVNSRLFWQTLRVYGKALAASTSLYGCLFCSDRSPAGWPVGYPVTFFYRHLELLSGVLTDSEFLADTLRERFVVPPSLAGKLATVHTPIVRQPRLASAPPEQPGRRRQVFWAGRFDRQKRLDVVLAIAERQPDADFRIWGEAVLDEDYSDLTVPRNVRFEGVYEEFEELPLEECDAWLYTAAWDGVPNMLLEVAAAGVPLVASLVEGTAEVLVDGLCERVPEIEDLEGFSSGLARVFADPAAARERAARLRDLTLAERTLDRFRGELLEIVGAGVPA